MRRIWVRFVAGAEPWSKGGLEEMLVFDSDGCRVSNAEEVIRRKHEAMEDPGSAGMGGCCASCRKGSEWEDQVPAANTSLSTGCML